MVREGVSDEGLVLVQLKAGGTAWAFATDVSRRRMPPMSMAAQQRGPGGNEGACSSGLDDSAEPGLAVGTLRWKKTFQFPPLDRPSWGTSPPERLENWPTYTAARKLHLNDQEKKAALIDGLSFPLSLLWAWEQLALEAPQHLPTLGEELTIVLIGASQKAEERLLYETSYWQELLHYPRVFPAPLRLKLLLAGHEISRHGDERIWTPRLRSACFRGSVGNALRAHKCEPGSAILVGYNTGCGSGIDSVMAGWALDLHAALDTGYLAFFTCANDYADLKGELALHVALKSREALQSRKNPFPGMVIVNGPVASRDKDGNEVMHWYRANDSLYAVRGLHPTRTATGRSPQELLEDVKKVARWLRKTEEISPRP